VDGDSEKKFTDGMATAAKGAAALALAVGAAATAVVAAVARIASQFDTLYYTSQRTGASVQNIKGLGYAFSQLGGSASQAVGTLESFTKALRNNPGLTNFVKGIGVNVNQDKAKVLTDVIDKLAQKPYYIGAQQAEMLGISEESFNLMVKNRAELARYRAEYDRTARTVGLNNDEAAKASRAFNDALISLRATATAVAEKIGTDLAPVITRYLNMLRDWIAANPDKIEAAIKQVIAVAEALVTTSASLVLALKPVGEMFQHIAETLTGKDGLQASMELFAVFLVTTWLTRILGAFGKVGLGWAALLLAIGIDTYKNSTPEGRANTVRDGEAALNSQADEAAANGKLGLWDRAKKFGRTALGAIGLGGDTAAPADTSGGRSRAGGNAAGAKESFDFWKEKGLTDAQAAGLVGMEQGESQFNPRSVGDGGLAHGAFQHHPDRRANILRGTGIDISTATHRQQLEAAHWEMTKGKEQAAWARIKAAETAGAAAAAGVRYFERPRDVAGESRLRGEYANHWLKKFGENNSPPSDKPQAANSNTENSATVYDRTQLKPSNDQPKAAPIINLPKVAASVNKFDLSGVVGAPALGSSSWDNRTSNTTMHQETKIEVNGASDPAAVGSMVERNQDRVNSTMLRNATGAVR
jgi:hypothetical protein